MSSGEVSPSAAAAGDEPAGFSVWVELTKPRLTMLVLVTVAVGYLLAAYERGMLVEAVSLHSALVLLVTVFGVGLSSGGSAALNMFVERHLDARMQRTRERPLPSGRLSELQVLLFGLIACSLGGLLVLLVGGPLAAWLNLATIVLYLLFYTPLKRLSSLNTLVGAVTGALPPMIGWAAFAHELAPGAWALFAIVYVWQLPHFFAIAWLYREDYRAGGMKMLSTVDRDGLLTKANIGLCSMVLVPVSLSPTMVGLAGPVYLWGALVIGVAQLCLSVRFVRCHTQEDARRVFLASLLYLPLLLALLLVDTFLIDGLSRI
ncbi:MAG: protoheme IX farnesyltransferase [Planctomycetota bacterium]|nr:MAG: protoheme IX farnesyltransferase [Planctomycetota bacterium]